MIPEALANYGEKNIMKIGLMACALLLAAAGSLVAAESCGGDFCIDRFTIAAGGEILADDGQSPPQWQLSGTIGQWEATSARELSGADWRLTGGFWGFNLQELSDLLFRDRFEEDE